MATLTSAERPLLLLLGPTASGKSRLAVALAKRFAAEVISCDSVAVYRGMDLGSAKPTLVERETVPHHLLDLYDPPQPTTAGDYARQAREALTTLTSLPLVVGGTGLYARALLDGLFAAPAANPDLRELLRRRAEHRGSTSLHRTLARFDPRAAALIHPNDLPKIVRAVEVSVARRRPITEQWTAGREPLTGYRVLRLTLAPPRAELYARIDRRASEMFARGLVEETRGLIARWGAECRPFASLGYAQAAAVLRGELTEADAIAQAQQGHRNYAKRQMTWFRREADLHPTHWLEGTGDDPRVEAQAMALVTEWLNAGRPLREDHEGA